MDSTTRGLAGDGALQVDLGYASLDATQSFFGGRTPLSGILIGFMCEGCSRVFFYAQGELPTEPETSEESDDPTEWIGPGLVPPPLL